MVTTVRVGDVVEVKVRAVAAGGAGVADLPDGRVVFVQRTAPGDRATLVELFVAWLWPSAAPVPVLRSLRGLHAGALGVSGAAPLEGAHGGRRSEAYRSGHGGPAGGRALAVRVPLPEPRDLHTTAVAGHCGWRGCGLPRDG